MTTFDDMLQGLRDAFSIERVNVDEVKSLLSSYTSNEADWKKFAYFDPYRYTRNLVDGGNGHYNVMLLCWGPGMASSIHDHADAHCFVKILTGHLTETLYDWPDMQVLDSDESSGETKKVSSHMNVRQVNVLPTDGVAYINDSIGLHRMENASHSESAVSLHVYIPAFNKCRIFDEQTGRTSLVKFTFWSQFGERSKPRQKKGGANQKKSEKQPLPAIATQHNDNEQKIADKKITDDVTRSMGACCMHDSCEK